MTEPSEQLWDSITKLSLQRGDIVVVTSANARNIAEGLVRAAKDHRDLIPDCPIVLLAPGDTIETLPRERLERILKRT